MVKPIRDLYIVYIIITTEYMMGMYLRVQLSPSNLGAKVRNLAQPFLGHVVKTIGIVNGET